MRIAIQEDMLAGRDLLEKFARARDLGFDGIEFWAKGLPDRIEEAAAALENTGLAASGVNFGRQSSLLSPDPAERERALGELREAIMCASDLGAEGVGFVPAFFGAALPDLSPFMTPEQLESELLIAHLRTLEDYADAMGVTLFLEPINRYETHFLNRVEQAAALARRRNHRRIKVVADLFHMALDEADIPAAIRAHADVIGYVHLADSNRRLPGQGFTPFAEAAAALNEIGYQGWAALECGDPGDNAPRANTYALELPACAAYLRGAGF
ncbi:MAG: sugar phosphate isomerase/epimerase [Anaerolineae bacterium]|nr:sugar phosphate isomerase/epimerase [Anaerolineae bacterium]